MMKNCLATGVCADYVDGKERWIASLRYKPRGFECKAFSGSLYPDEYARQNPWAWVGASDLASNGTDQRIPVGADTVQVEAISVACTEDEAATELASREAEGKAEAERLDRLAETAKKAEEDARAKILAAELQAQEREYERTQEWCVRVLSPTPCNANRSHLAVNVRNSCWDDCQSKISAKADELRADGVFDCKRTYVADNGLKAPTCAISHRGLGDDNEVIARISKECAVQCKKEAPIALAEYRRDGARRRADERRTEALSRGEEPRAPSSQGRSAGVRPSGAASHGTDCAVGCATTSDQCIRSCGDNIQCQAACGDAGQACVAACR